jgi:hypothetical protein
MLSRKLPFSLPVTLLNVALGASFAAEMFPSVVATWFYDAKEITNKEWKERLENIKKKIKCTDQIEFKTSNDNQLTILGKQVLVPTQYLELKIKNNQERWALVSQKNEMIYTEEEVDAMIAFQIAGAEMNQELSLWSTLFGAFLALQVAFVPLPTILSRSTLARVSYFKEPLIVLPIAWGSMFLNSRNFDERLARVSSSEYVTGLARQLKSETHYNKTYLRTGFLGYLRYSKNGADRFGPYPYATVMLKRVHTENVIPW